MEAAVIAPTAQSLGFLAVAADLDRHPDRLAAACHGLLGQGKIAASYLSLGVDWKAITHTAREERPGRSAGVFVWTKAPVAQRIEQGFPKAKVTGSTPVGGIM